jgi:hypothetical protein
MGCVPSFELYITLFLFTHQEAKILRFLKKLVKLDADLSAHSYERQLCLWLNNIFPCKLHLTCLQPCMRE